MSRLSRQPFLSNRRNRSGTFFICCSNFIVICDWSDWSDRWIAVLQTREGTLSNSLMFLTEDCSCFQRCPWDKFDRMRLATTQRSVCWRRVANGNELYSFLSVCPNDRSLPTSSATTRPSLHWKGVSNGRVLCSCSGLWKRLTSNQTLWATTAASPATVLGSGKPPCTSLRRCNRRQSHQMLWWTGWCHFWITSLALLWTILTSKNSASF